MDNVPEEEKVPHIVAFEIKETDAAIEEGVH
jgi:hypothetical protein